LLTAVTILKETVLLVLLYPLQYLLRIRLPGGQSQHMVIAVGNFQKLRYGTIVLFIPFKIAFVQGSRNDIIGTARYDQ
jgi:hypothetical protein